MSRYFTRAAIIANPQDAEPFSLYDLGSGGVSMTVHEDEKETFTGLLDASGQQIHRTERIALGFGRR